MKNNIFILLILTYLLYVPNLVYANTTIEPTSKESTSTTAINLEESKIKNITIPIDGSATVIENSIQASDTREFFTIETPEGNIFYIVVDKKRQQNNVYLLSQVGENELLKLAKKQDNGKEYKTIIDEEQDILKALTTKTEEETKEKTTTEYSTEQLEQTNRQEKKTNILPIILIMLIVLAIAYYFKIYKPKQNKNDTDYEEEFEIEEDTETKESKKIGDMEDLIINENETEDIILNDDIEELENEFENNDEY